MDYLVKRNIDEASRIIEWHVLMLLLLTLHLRRRLTSTTTRSVLPPNGCLPKRPANRSSHPQPHVAVSSIF